MENALMRLNGGQTRFVVAIQPGYGIIFVSVIICRVVDHVLKIDHGLAEVAKYTASSIGEFKIQNLNASTIWRGTIIVVFRIGSPDKVFTEMEYWIGCIDMVCKSSAKGVTLMQSRIIANSVYSLEIDRTDYPS